MIPFKNTPYLLSEESEQKVLEKIKELEQRVILLRNSNILTDRTLESYYGAKRFEQVAESNAIEGSTLSIGETELAIVKGITITGHDPAYSKDAIALDNALTKLVELAKNREAKIDNFELNIIHGLILEDQIGAGIFRKEPVRISGASHIPPETHSEVLDAMTLWSEWSKDNSNVPSIIRAAILHAWLVHIHPFIDGNGRVARAITNLELIRSGFPPILIKKKDRDIYIDALSHSDEAGDLLPFFELIINKANDALIGLEIIAKQKDGYDPVAERIKLAHKKQLKIWENTVTLLSSAIDYIAETKYKDSAVQINVHKYETTLDIEDFEKVCSGTVPSQSWAFKIECTIPGFPVVKRLAWVGSRSFKLKKELGDESGPSIFWSRPNVEGFPTWITDESMALGKELTIKNGNGDSWFVWNKDQKIKKLGPTELAEFILEELIKEIML